PRPVRAATHFSARSTAGGTMRAPTPRRRSHSTASKSCCLASRRSIRPRARVEARGASLGVHFPPMLRDTAKRVLEIESRAIEALVGRVDGTFEAAVEAIVACKGRVIVTGMGKSGIICQKIAATLSSTGTPAFFMHPAEATHGDLGMIVKGDSVLAVSSSGETDELIRLLETIRRLGANLISMTGNPASH